MKMSEIEKGKEYAFKFSTHDRLAQRIRVIEVGVSYGDSPGRGIWAEFLSGRSPGRRMVLLAQKVICLWDEWEKRKIESERIHERNKVKAKAMEARVEIIRARLDAARLETVRVAITSLRVHIKFYSLDELDRFLEIFNVRE